MLERGPVHVADERLLKVLDPDVGVELLGGDATWSEGPQWLPGDEAVMTGPSGSLIRLTGLRGRTRGIPVILDVEEPNGLAFSPDERLTELARSPPATSAPWPR